MLKKKSITLMEAARQCCPFIWKSTLNFSEIQMCAKLPANFDPNIIRLISNSNARLCHIDLIDRMHTNTMLRLNIKYPSDKFQIKDEETETLYRVLVLS